jgi:hypothetical protein
MVLPSSEDASSLKSRVEALEADLTRRQESYIRRERAYNLRVEELEDEVSRLKAGKTGWMREDKNMQNLQAMHTSILHNVELVQDRTAKIMQEQERDLLRAFRARLFDVQTELEKEKQKKNDGASTWIERTRQTEAELDWAKEMADRLDRVNQGLSKENARLKGHFHSQEEDRAFLIKQLVSVKKENTLLRQDMQAMDEQMRALQDAAKSREAELTTVQSQVTRRKFSTMPISGGPAAAAAGAAAPYTLLQHSDAAGMQSAPLLMTAASAAGALSSADADARYKDVLSRMKRLLETERRALRLARAAYASELQQRSDLETLLRAAVDDVRAELAVTRQRLSSPAQFSGKESRGASRGGGSRGGTRAPAATATTANSAANTAAGAGALLPEVAISELGRDERDRVLELLLSQERVITLLYSKTFPVKGQAADAAPAGAVAAAASSHAAVKAALVKSGSMASLPLPVRPESAA